METRRFGKHRDMEIWRHGDTETGVMETWKHGDKETMGHGNIETWRHGKIET
jgi:hypothetical protein